MPRFPDPHLSRRERQIMDVVYRHGRATAADIADELPDPPTQDAVRAAIRLLESKGHLTHESDGQRHVYRPTVPREAAGRSALREMVRTFFSGSPSEVVSTLFELEDVKPTRAELDRLADLIERARNEEEAP